MEFEGISFGDPFGFIAPESLEEAVFWEKSVWSQKKYSREREISFFRLWQFLLSSLN